jgi:GNAT superfamily N-acetyltransferase
MSEGVRADATAAPEVTVRRARTDEAGALAALAAVTFPLACPPSSTPEDHAAFIAAHLTPASFAGYLADPARDLLVADENGALVGYTMLVAGEPYDPDVAAAVPLRPTVELSKCYVLPGRHGGGVARALMAASLDAHASAGPRACGSASTARTPAPRRSTGARGSPTSASARSRAATRSTTTSCCTSRSETLRDRPAGGVSPPAPAPS